VVLAFGDPWVYYLDMASIVGKKQGNKTYYYLVESGRVGGKPRIVSQRYLGSAEEVMARLEERGPGEPDRTRHLAFGDLAAVWGILDRLGVVGVVDDVVGQRRADAAGSVGTYLALACANRVVAPCSKLAFSDWWETTAGDRLVKLPAAALDHRRFWDAMDHVTAEHLTEIERRITRRMVDEFDLDLSGLVLDMTNFATYIDSANDRAPIAQRGHAKQKRTDLRLVGLGLVVTTDGAVPLVSHAYGGNRNDTSQFATVLDELTARFGELAAQSDQLTVVYDAGQGSAHNHGLIEDSPLHFVSSVRPTDHHDLLAVPRSSYQVVDADRFGGLLAFETRASIFDHDRRVVVTWSPRLADKQRAGFAQTLAKARLQLRELGEGLRRATSRRNVASVEAEIASITRPRWVARVVRTSLTGTAPGALTFTWRVDRRAVEALEAELFGKRVLYTDRDDWSLAEVVAAYRSQSDVEGDFRQLKDPKVVSFSPMFHWTDAKIRVHAFYCVLALRVARLMQREVAHAGMPMSARELLAQLGGIEETVLLYQGDRGRPRARRMLTEVTATQQRLYDLFDLERYAPKR
jgi:transposase